MRINKARLTRKQFEALFTGEWEVKVGDRYRVNGKLQTTVEKGWKIFRTEGGAIRSRTWIEIAKALKLQGKSENEVLVKPTDHQT